MNSKIKILVPWRPTPERIPACELVSKFYSDYFPDIPISYCDSSHATFNRSAALNLGISKSIDDKYDLLIINDADTLPESGPLLESMSLAMETQEIVVPYDTYIQHEADDSLTIFSVDYKISLAPCSGTLVIPLKLFTEYQIDLFEERIDSWGPEDQLFHKRYIDKVGKTFKSIAGNCTSLYTADTNRGYNKKFEPFHNEIRSIFNN